MNINDAYMLTKTSFILCCKGVRCPPPPYREPPRPRGLSPFRASPGTGNSPLPVAMTALANQSPGRGDHHRSPLTLPPADGTSTPPSRPVNNGPNSPDNGDLALNSGTRSRRNLVHVIELNYYDLLFVFLYDYCSS